jgi:sec-independent protein translocase protein TatB
MFDVGFSEIMVIAVVALIVIGPERLPKAARTLGHLFGRLQRYVADVKADINREMQLEELKKLQQEVQTAATEIETSVSAVARDAESGVRGVESDLNAAGSTSTTAAGESSLPAELPPPPVLPPVAEGADAPRQASLPGLDRG